MQIVGASIAHLRGIVRFQGAASRRIPRLFFVDRARVVLVGDHEDDDLQSFVAAHVVGHRMDGARRLVKNIARFQHADPVRDRAGG